jgi:hypothetical protein
MTESQGQEVIFQLQLLNAHVDQLTTSTVAIEGQLNVLQQVSGIYISGFLLIFVVLLGVWWKS